MLNWRDLQVAAEEASRPFEREHVLADHGAGGDAKFSRLRHDGRCKRVLRIEFNCSRAESTI